MSNTDSTLREDIEAITDEFTQPGTKYLRDLNNKLIALIALKVQEARIDELRMARNVDSQLSSSDIVDHLVRRLSKLRKERKRNE